MNYRKLGRTGLEISELSFGSWVTLHNQVDVAKTYELMKAALNAGMNFFDNAEAYANGKSEEIMGEAIRRLGLRRGEYLVSTKLFWGLHDTPNERNTLNRKYLLEGIAGSLERMGLDYVDLLYCHRADPDTPIEETVWAMHNIIERGQALYWGTSEWDAADILSAIDIAEKRNLHKPVVEQPVYNLLQRHRFAGDYARVYEEYGYGSTTWSPLASGLLTGKYIDGLPEDSRAALPEMSWLKGELVDKERNALVRKLVPLASDMGATLAQFSIAWCLQNPSVSSVITGASRVEQLAENVKALDFVDKFTPDIMSEIDRILGV